MGEKGSFVRFDTEKLVMSYVVQSEKENTERLAARFISVMFAPPLVIFTAAVTASSCDSGLPCWIDIWTFVGVSIILPLLLLCALRAKGLVVDFDLSNRSERAVPLLSAAGAAGVSWAVLLARSPGGALTSFAGIQALCLLALLSISLYWKISIHASAVATLGSVVSTQNVLLTIVVFALLGLVCWARVYLGKHTVGQVIAGSILGGLAFAIWSLC